MVPMMKWNGKKYTVDRFSNPILSCLSCVLWFYSLYLRTVFRYTFGIIDILQKYNFKKKVEGNIKVSFLGNLTFYIRRVIHESMYCNHSGQLTHALCLDNYLLHLFMSEIGVRWSKGCFSRASSSLCKAIQ